MVCMIVLSVILSVGIVVLAVRTAKELPDSVSSFSYYVGDVRFAIWASATAVLLLFPVLHVLPAECSCVGGLMSVGLLLVAASPYYRTENKVQHYTGGYLFGLCSQAVVALLMPCLLLSWTLFPLVFIRRSWRENATFVAEATCYLTLSVSLIVSLLS